MVIDKSLQTSTSCKIPIAPKHILFKNSKINWHQLGIRTAKQSGYINQQYSIYP
jgi:hypothetical protein